MYRDRGCTRRTPASACARSARLIRRLSRTMNFHCHWAMERERISHWVMRLASIGTRETSRSSKIQLLRENEEPNFDNNNELEAYATKRKVISEKLLCHQVLLTTTFTLGNRMQSIQLSMELRNVVNLLYLLLENTLHWRGLSWFKLFFCCKLRYRSFFWGAVSWCKRLHFQLVGAFDSYLFLSI